MYIFENAQEVFEYYYKNIVEHGHYSNGTKRLFNVGFYISNPTSNHINTKYRKWSLSYAEREWRWYLSQNRSVKELKKYAPIWDKMHNGSYIVNSNYGWQWNRNEQLRKCINQIWQNSNTRRAWLSIFDGKEKRFYDFDTPCTLAIGFLISQKKLCMNVMMRSNDLWYGFCNDQYAFSKLQQYVANSLEVPIGWYYHHVNDLHIYNDNLPKK